MTDNDSEVSSTSTKPSQQPLIYANNAILNPIIPYCEELRTLYPGDIVIINGFIPQGSKNFSINLQQLIDGEKYDILLHLGVRFTQNVVIRNHRVEGEWFEEEKPGGLGKLQTGKPFECFLMLRDDYFKIAFNGKHHSDFVHRLPYKQITHLVVEGSVQLSAITIQDSPDPNGGKLTNGPFMPPLSQAKQQSKSKSGKSKHHPGESFALYGMPIPHRDELCGGLKPTSALYISGIPHRNATQFNIDLKPVSMFGQKDVAFHLKVMMRQQTVVLNSMDNGKWGKEERLTEKFPFKGGVHYDLIILCMEDRFKISVNNVHFAEYMHRFKQLENINMYEVNGSTKLVHIRKLVDTPHKVALI